VCYLSVSLSVCLMVLPTDQKEWLTCILTCLLLCLLCAPTLPSPGQEFDKMHQRALNYEDYTTAKELRRRRQDVDEALRELYEAKGSACGARQASQTDVADYAAEGLRLRSEMQRAAEEER
jgi:hypothetical protein